MNKLIFKDGNDTIVINLDTIEFLQFDQDDEIITIAHTSGKSYKISKQSDNEEWEDWLIENTDHLIEPTEFYKLLDILFEIKVQLNHT